MPASTSMQANPSEFLCIVRHLPASLRIYNDESFEADTIFSSPSSEPIGFINRTLSGENEWPSYTKEVREDPGASFLAF